MVQLGAYRALLLLLTVEDTMTAIPQELRPTNPRLCLERAKAVLVQAPARTAVRSAKARRSKYNIETDAAKLIELVDSGEAVLVVWFVGS